MANTTEHITIRLPKNLAERVRARAAAEGRSVSGMITRLVQWAMEGAVDESPIIEAPMHSANKLLTHNETRAAVKEIFDRAERTVEYEE